MSKNILLIGGSYGIGLEIAKLMNQDCNVYVASRTQGELPAGVTHIPFNVLEDDITTLDLPETLHGLAYCPGSINLRPFRMLKPQAFQKDFEINFMSLVKVVHGVMPRLLEAEQASLVFFSTVAAKVGMPYHTSVAASKGAIEGFAKALAAEYAPSLRVNVVAPSLTDTPLAGKLLSTEEKQEKMAARHPLNRVGTASDIGEIATFLLSDKSSWMTGQVLGVDGGISSLNMQ